MPVLSHEATISHRLQLSKHALVLYCSCLFATLFGVLAITISFQLVVENHAGSPAYWSTVAVLLVTWLGSLFNMYRLAIRQARAGFEAGRNLNASTIRVNVAAGIASDLAQR
jgi:hypothetical protein